ncbi:MAG: LptE family protein [Blastocatellia bacterium]|nr:LptE family protein [Blastocatellia bacterium]
MERRSFLSLLLFSLCVGAGPCGYERSGQGRALPDHIKTIAIETFRNESLRYKVEQRFTEAMITELLHRTSRFKFTSDVNKADAIVCGNIRNFGFRHVLLDNNGRTRVFEITINAGVVIKDQINNKVLYDNQRLVFRGEYELSDDPNSFFNEEDPAVTRLARDFAKSVLTTVMEGF